MITPIVYFNADKEKASLQDLAIEQFVDYYKHQQALAAPAPTVEEVYPKLANIARQLGCTAQCPIVFKAYSSNDLSEKISQIGLFVDKVFNAYPHLVRSLLVMPEPRKENHLPAPPELPRRANGIAVYRKQFALKAFAIHSKYNYQLCNSQSGRPWKSAGHCLRGDAGASGESKD